MEAAIFSQEVRTRVMENDNVIVVAAYPAGVGDEARIAHAAGGVGKARAHASPHAPGTTGRFVR